jgi:hypothetical protein
VFNVTTENNLRSAMSEFVERRKGERRKGPIRSGAERRKEAVPPPSDVKRSGSERRRKDRRSGQDRRKS